MSIQVDFYILESNDEESRMNTLCRLTEKVYRMGHKIQVLTNAEEQSKQLDELMWSFSDVSFLPHASYSKDNEFMDKQPILIHHKSIEAESEVLINLRTDIPSKNNVKRIVEIINQDENIRTNGRDKYRQYQKSQFAIYTHKLPS